MSKFFSFSAVVAAALVATSAHAAPITTLFNTGVNAAGVALAHGTNPDPHYALISVPSGSTVTRAITSAGGFPFPNYFTGGTASRWIVPNNGTGNAAGDNSPVGDYIFRTTFDLTGFNYTTASITGGWATDNSGVEIRLNGVNKMFGHPSNFGSPAVYSAFSLTSGFVAGINTIDFVVNNAQPTVQNNQNPVALRVEMTGTANVPEPGALALVGMALFAAGLARRRSAR